MKRPSVRPSVCRLSVCRLSVCPVIRRAAGLLLSAAPCGQKISIDSGGRRSTALSSKCEQRHVFS